LRVVDLSQRRGHFIGLDGRDHAQRPVETARLSVRALVEENLQEPILPQLPGT